MNMGRTNQYLNTLYKYVNKGFNQEDMYIKDIKIEDKNELINDLKMIFHDISRSSEFIEYNFSFINEDQNHFPLMRNSEILYKFGTNSSQYKQVCDLYKKILSHLETDKNGIKYEKNNLKEDVKMKEEKNIDLENYEEKISKTNSLCDELNKVMKQYKENKKKKEEGKMSIENEKKTVKVDGVEMIFEDEKKLLKILNEEGYNFDVY